MIKNLCLIMFIALSMTPQKGFPKKDIAYNFQIAPQLPDGTYGEFGNDISNTYLRDYDMYPVILRVKNKDFQKYYHLFTCDAECSDGVYIKIGDDVTNKDMSTFVIYYANQTGVSSSVNDEYYIFHKRSKKLQLIKTTMTVEHFDSFIEELSKQP